MVSRYSAYRRGWGDDSIAPEVIDRILIGACAEAAFLGYVLVLGRRAHRAGRSADIEEAPDFAPVAG